MNYEKKIDKGQAFLTFTIAPADYKKDVEAAAVRLSERAAIKGFRPGKAPYEMVKQQLGELRIMEEAAERVIQHAYFEAVKAEKLAAIGMPQVAIQKMAPGNDFVFTATVALLPEVKLPDLKKIKIDVKEVKVGDADVDKVLEDLRKMQPKETPKAGAAAKEDKLVIDMDMFLDKIPVEGGQAKGHQVYLSEPHYIPGLAEKLIGLKKDDAKEFTLKFPKEHYQKHLANKDVDIKVKVNEVYTIEYATLDDEFAKAVGQESLAKLKELLTTNIAREAESKEKERQDVAILDQLIEKTTFGEIPAVLIDSEKHKMFNELKYDLDRRGIPMEQYLLDIKKKEDEIYADFTEQGTKRAKAALISRQFATDNAITVDKAAMDAELAAIRQSYAGDTTVEENLKRPEVLDTIEATIQNRKVLALLKEKITNQK